MLLRVSIGSLHSLVCIWSPLTHSGLVSTRFSTATGATAGAEGPEQGCDEGASDGEPEIDKHGGAELEFDVVLVEGEVEGCDQAGVRQRSEEGEGEEEGGADEGGDGGEEAAESAEECANADQDLEADGDDAKNVETGRPLGGSLFVVIQSVVRTLGEEGITELSIEAPNFLWIEPEVELPTGAELDALGVLLIDCKRRPSHAVS